MKQKSNFEVQITKEINNRLLHKDGKPKLKLKLCIMKN